MLHEILDCIDLRFDVTVEEIPQKLKEFEDKTILFNTPKGRAVGNLCASRNKIKDHWGIDTRVLLNAIENPKDVRVKNDGNVKSNIIEPDLSKLPISSYYAQNGGRYINSGVIVAKDPEYGRNMSFHRMMVAGEDRLVLRLCPRDLYTYYNRVVERGEDLEIAICIGLHPAVLLSAATSPEIEFDELTIASALLDDFYLVKCETVDLEVPDAEIVLEGKITQETAPEGPYVDITQTLDFVREQPIIQLSSMMHRDDPIYHTLMPATQEHFMLMGMPREPTILREVKKVADVADVYLTKGGSGWLHAVISINKQSSEDAKNAIDAAFRGHPSLKHVVIVDGDIDPCNCDEVEWAIATRFQADRDLVVFENARGSTLDPSAEDGITSKLGFDATKPSKDAKFDRVF